MKSSSSTNARDGVRIKVLGPIAVLAALILAALLFKLSHSQPANEAPADGSMATINSNIPPEPARNTGPKRQALRPAQSEMEPETARLTSILLDKSAPLQVRREAARSLGKIGTDEAMAVLKSALAGDIPPHAKAAIAEGLGESPNPAARELLHELANGKDETVARGAARGLAERGDADAVDTLGSLLFNNQTSLSVRTEAALALGDVNLPTAQDQLTRAVAQIHDEDVLESALDGLGRRPFSDTQEFFRTYLNSPDVPAASKVLAIEAIRDADGDVAPFLSTYLNDSNPAVRAAAKDAVEFLAPIPTKPATVK